MQFQLSSSYNDTTIVVAFYGMLALDTVSRLKVKMSTMLSVLNEESIIIIYIMVKNVSM